VEVEIGSYPISPVFRRRCSPHPSQLEQTEHGVRWICSGQRRIEPTSEAWEAYFKARKRTNWRHFCVFRCSSIGFQLEQRDKNTKVGRSTTQVSSFVSFHGRARGGHRISVCNGHGSQTDLGVHRHDSIESRICMPSRSTIKADSGYNVGLPIAAYLTWQGRLIESKGVTPGIPVGLSPKDLLAGQDPQMQRALELARSI